MYDIHDYLRHLEGTHPYRCIEFCICSYLFGFVRVGQLFNLKIVGIYILAKAFLTISKMTCRFDKSLSLVCFPFSF